MCAFLQGDAVLRVTNSCICGSDLHLFLRGMPGMKSGDVLGHEVRGKRGQQEDREWETLRLRQPALGGQVFNGRNPNTRGHGIMEGPMGQMATRPG